MPLITAVNLLLFAGWVLLVFACSDLVGRMLRVRFPSILSPLSPDGSGADDRPLVDFARSALGGFAALWLSLSAAYALGIATREVIVAIIVLSALVAALVRRRDTLHWVRARLRLWGLVGVIALLASFVAPRFNQSDDPEYFFLIGKLLQTGSVVEYFNLRRPITLGGWTFLQAIFSAGPAGPYFVSWIDSVLGAILFFLCALLLGAGLPAAFAAATCGTLLMQTFQYNLGTAIAMAGSSAVLVGLSASASSSPFTSLAFAAMAVTIRPQLGLVAATAVAVVLTRVRINILLVGVALLVGMAAVWLTIFVRDTSLLPLSTSPGDNPQAAELYVDHSPNQPSLSKQLVLAGQDEPVAVILIVLALGTCVWYSAMRRPGTDMRSESRVFGVFALAAVATGVAMIALLGSLARGYDRYYIPVASGFLYAFFVRSGVHIVETRPPKPLAHASSWFGIGAIVLCLVLGFWARRLSPPFDSPGEICPQLLSQAERQALRRIPHGSGYTLLAIDCPIGSFNLSPRVMMNDLFFATRGEYFDIDSSVEATVTWLRRQRVAQLLYLENDSSRSFGLVAWRNFLSTIKADQSYFAAFKRRQYQYVIDGSAKLRALAQYCDTHHLPISNPQGPLVIIDMSRCDGLAAGTAKARVWP